MTAWSSEKKLVRQVTAGEQGDEIVEFAIVTVAMLTILSGIIDCSRALYAYHFTSYAAREATRYAVVRGSSWGAASCARVATLDCNASSDSVKAYVKSIVPPGIDQGTALTVTTTWPGAKVAGSSGSCAIPSTIYFRFCLPRL
jgi:Flp pilus assembly protein TadG